MTKAKTPDTTPEPDGIRLALLDVGGLLAALDAVSDALDAGDPFIDTTPDQAARAMFRALDDAGYVIVRKVAE